MSGTVKCRRQQCATCTRNFVEFILQDRAIERKQKSKKILSDSTVKADKTGFASLLYQFLAG